MRKVKIVLLLIMLNLLIFLPYGKVFAEERSIYVGDLINIKVTSQSITEEELREKFADFEIVDLKKGTDGYIITVRTFDVGERTIQLGDKELNITVKSTMDDMFRTEAYEGNLNTKSADSGIRWRYLLYGSALVFLVSGGILLVTLKRHKRFKALTPYQHFLKQLEQILLTEDTCFVRWTQCLKEYLEAKFSCNIKGKTSSEILEEIGDISAIQEDRPLLSAWLEECDCFKFSGTAASIEHKQKLLDSLKTLVLNMENEKEVEA